MRIVYLDYYLEASNGPTEKLEIPVLVLSPAVAFLEQNPDTLERGVFSISKDIVKAILLRYFNPGFDAY